MVTEAVFGSAGEDLLFPRVYRPPLADRVMLAIFGALCFGFGLTAVWLWFRRPDPALLMLGAILAISGVALALYKLGSATFLTADTIERRDLFGRRVMRKADIAGCRLSRPGRGLLRIALVPKSPDVRPLSVDAYAPDKVLSHWFAGLPDLDLVEKARAERAMLSDPTLGESVDSRRASVASLSRLAKTVNAVGGVVLIWAFVVPLPLVAAVAASALAPPCALALVAWSKGRLIFFPARNNPRPAVPGLMFAWLALPARALFDITLDDWTQTVAPALGLGLIVALAVWMVDRRYASHLGGLAALAVGAGLYGWGLTCEVDRLADCSPAQVFATQVVDEHVSAGRYTRYVLTLAPWRGEAGPRELAVGRALYEATPRGAPVCVRSHAGALGMRWLQVRPCPPSAA